MPWCSCTECSAYPGGRREVSRTTRSQHLKRDARNASASPEPALDHEEEAEEEEEEVPDIGDHINAGIGREKTGKILKALHLIFATLLQALVVALLGPTAAAQLPKIPIPADPRTLYGATLEPQINRIVCCSECFSMYPDNQPIPEICRWRKNPRRGKFCNTELWKYRKTRKGLKRVPRLYYAVQHFGSFLSYFLGRAVIREALEKSAAESYQRAMNGYPKEMTDVQESPAWRGLGNFTHAANNLVWAIYIDWFNLFSNKIAGKIVSSGAIILYCLSLPYHLRFQLDGIIPGPKMPNVWTISYIVDSLVQALNQYQSPRQYVETPSGHIILVQVLVLALIADLAAIRKVAGFLAHNAKQFCSYCHSGHQLGTRFRGRNCALVDALVGVSVCLMGGVWPRRSTPPKAARVDGMANPHQIP
uniref:Integral membrane protein n=1 Tax=Mycena chlorophos TaxID=658473 RepID=A0ABQ0L222_MYCCL|nr:predicted protein [Mycena chlorophos]